MELDMLEKNHHHRPPELILVLGATGKTGRRVVDRLEALDMPVRPGSRRAAPAFDWTQEATWDACLEGVSAVYINYASELPVRGSADVISDFVDAALRHEVRRLVLLSGRGEPEARVWERVVQESGLDWTIVRSSWFQENFSEGPFAEMVEAGEIFLSAGDIPEAFVSLEDIADVVTAALTQSGHAGEVYEVSGPRLLTFAQATAELAAATGRPILYQQIPHDALLAAVVESGAHEEEVWLIDYLFGEILDGRNASVTDGVKRALGRAPRDFSDFATTISTTKSWSTVV